MPRGLAQVQTQPRFAAYPFSLGVASGYPAPGSVVLWTRLAPVPDAPGGGTHWGAEAWHGDLPRGDRNVMKQSGTFAEILHGPSRTADGTMNIIGALRKAMAITGYSDVKEFQRVEMVVTA